VVKNPKKPFLVKTGYINIKVLGTAFNVKSYPEENSIETTLDRGLIEITKEKGNAGVVTIKPKEKMTYAKFPKQLAITDKKGNASENKNDQVPENIPSKKTQAEFQIDKHVNTELVTSWKEGKMIFESERL
jgi:hypothetical protein